MFGINDIESITMLPDSVDQFCWFCSERCFLLVTLKRQTITKKNGLWCCRMFYSAMLSMLLGIDVASFKNLGTWSCNDLSYTWTLIEFPSHWYLRLQIFLKRVYLSFNLLTFRRTWGTLRKKRLRKENVQQVKLLNRQKSYFTLTNKITKHLLYSDFMSIYS